MLDKLLSCLLGREQKDHQWSEERGVYALEIFTDHKKFASHRLTVEYHPVDPGTVSPIPDRDRESMWDPGVQGPLEENFSDATFRIEKHVMLQGYLPVFQAYFLFTEFRFGSEHAGSTGINSMMRDFQTSDDFKRRIMEYFKLRDYNEFAQFFTRSNLPEEQREAVKSISSF